MERILITMRLADMTFVHPEQITGKCSKCLHTVGIYPSGQHVIRSHPDLKIVCQVCMPPSPNNELAPGALNEPFESRRKV